jgi:hypothetical protein
MTEMPNKYRKMRGDNMNMKKFMVITPIVALLCIAMFASLATPQAKAQVIPLNASYCISQDGNNPIQGGYVGNANGIIGTGPDGNWAQIYGAKAGEGGYIIAGMSAPVTAGSNVCVYAESVSGFTSTSVLSVYVGNSASGPFYLAGSQPIYTTSGSWYYFTSPSYPSSYPYTTFQYIYIQGTSSSGGEDVFIDSVLTM